MAIGSSRINAQSFQDESLCGESCGNHYIFYCIMFGNCIRMMLIQSCRSPQMHENQVTLIKVESKKHISDDIEIVHLKQCLSQHDL